MLEPELERATRFGIWCQTVLFNTSLRTVSMVIMTDSNNQPLTRKAMREQAEAIARKQAEEANQKAEEIVKDVEVDEEGNPIFRVSSALTGEITTTNLVVEVPMDITAGGSVITDAGEVVITDSIDVSALITHTGEISPITISDEADNDLDRDAKANYIPGIPPIRVSGVLARTQGQVAMPGGAHRGLNPYLIFGLLTLAGALIAGGVAIAFFLGYF